MGAGGGKAGGGGIGHRHGSPYANATVRKPANAWRVPRISTGERGSQAPVLCVLPQLLCPIFWQSRRCEPRLSGCTVLAPSLGGVGPTCSPESRRAARQCQRYGRLGRNENGTKSSLPPRSRRGRAAGSVRCLSRPIRAQQTKPWRRPRLWLPARRRWCGTTTCGCASRSRGSTRWCSRVSTNWRRCRRAPLHTRPAPRPPTPLPPCRASLLGAHRARGGGGGAVTRGGGGGAPRDRSAERRARNGAAEGAGEAQDVDGGRGAGERWFRAWFRAS